MRFQRKPVAPLITAAILVVFVLVFVQHLYAGPEKEKIDAARMWREIERTMPLTKHNLYNGRILLKYREKINLTPDQVLRIETLMMEFESYYILKSGEIKSKELRFAFYLRSGKNDLDRKEMAKYIREISGIKTDVIVKHVNYLLDLKNVLAPQQLESVKTLEDTRRKRKKHTSKSQK